MKTKQEEVTPSGEQPKKQEWRYVDMPLQVDAGNVRLRPSWKGVMDRKEIADVVRLAAAAPALYEALKELRARFFEDAQAGAYTDKGKLIPLDNDVHPWIPGAKAPDAIAAIDAALALVDGPQETGGR